MRLGGYLPRGLLDALDALFETVWRTAHPLELSGTGTESEPTVELGAEGPTDLDGRFSPCCWPVSPTPRPRRSSDSHRARCTGACAA